MEPSGSVECENGHHIEQRRPATQNTDLNQLESETLSILQRYGSPEAKNVTRLGPPVSLSSIRSEKVRPWTGVTAKNADSRPFTGPTSLSSRRRERPRTGLHSTGREQNRNIPKAGGNASENSLRETISSALSTSQFDSVPRLLASDKHTNEMENINNGQGIRSRNSPFLREASPYMISRMGVNNSTPKKITRMGALTKDNSDPSKNLKSLSLREISYPGVDKNTASNTTSESKISDKNMASHSEKQVCFNCWSAGLSNTCLIRTEIAGDVDFDPGQRNLSMCKNWNTDYLRRKYRSQEIQEKSSFLVFDKSQKEFSTFDHPKHPIYQLLSQQIARLNFTTERKQNVQMWFRSFIKKLKDGNFQGKRSNASAQILLLGSTIKSMMAVKKLSNEVKDQHPKAPVTGTSMREVFGKEQVLVETSVHINGSIEKRKFIITGPTPVPNDLYRARKYVPYPTVTIVLRDKIENLRLDFSSIMSSSIQYARFGRKRTNKNVAVGGLSAEVIVSQQFTGRFPAQYKNFTCNSKTVLVPPDVEQRSPSFQTLTVPYGNLPHIRRKLITPLDYRHPPAIMVKTGLEPKDRHFFGVNRPEQTGEEVDFGFRTSTWYSLPKIDDKINTKSFRPSQSVATPNLAVNSLMRTMKVDGLYPFRKEHSRTNRVEDLYHLLLSSGNCSRNKLQMFTCIGSQQCGYFMQNGNSSLPIGRVVTKVVRSWAFLQSESEEIATYKEESIPLGLGGVILNDRPRHINSMPSSVLTKDSRKDIRAVIFARKYQEPVRQEDPEADASEPGQHVSVAKDTTPLLTARTHENDSKTEEESSNTLMKQEMYESSPLKMSEVLDFDLKSQHAKQNSTSVVQVVKQDDTLVAESISKVIGETLKSFSNLATHTDSKPEDLIQLGMGIGASLGAQGFLKVDCAAQENTGSETESNEGNNAPQLLNVKSGGVPQTEMAKETPIQDAKISTIHAENSMHMKMKELTLDCFDNTIAQLGSLEESKHEMSSFDNTHILESKNLVNFSDFNVNPQDLLSVLAARHIGTKHVEYLSYTFSLNLTAPRKIEPQKPRPFKINGENTKVEEWEEAKFNPWSDGRDPTSSTFVQSVTHETKKWPKPKNRVDGPDFSNTAQEFATLCTLCRHGKYRELEEMINNPSWTLPIDYCDDSGNNLLMIACQNGNKRISKLCLRRGSQIDNKNLNGNTCLHFAFGYGFDDLGDYLISKGADDSLQNANCLTCYEGLDMDEL